MAQTVWKFAIGSISVRLDIEQECGYQYDGDDRNGSIQAALDDGDYIAFSSEIIVEKDGEIIGTDSLGGSVYGLGNISDFWTAHRTSAPEYRNTLAQKAMKRCICHYFPGMVSEAIRETRAFLNSQDVATIRAGKDSF